MTFNAQTNVIFECFNVPIKISSFFHQIQNYSTCFYQIYNRFMFQIVTYIKNLIYKDHLLTFSWESHVCAYTAVLRVLEIRLGQQATQTHEVRHHRQNVHEKTYDKNTYLLWTMVVCTHLMTLTWSSLEETFMSVHRSLCQTFNISWIQFYWWFFIFINISER